MTGPAKASLNVARRGSMGRVCLQRPCSIAEALEAAAPAQVGATAIRLRATSGAELFGHIPVGLAITFDGGEAAIAAGAQLEGATEVELQLLGPLGAGLLEGAAVALAPASCLWFKTCAMARPLRATAEGGDVKETGGWVLADPEIAGVEPCEGDLISPPRGGTRTILSVSDRVSTWLVMLGAIK